MNERVKELAAQAKFIAEETIDRKISKNAELDAFAEKFAELIVRECVHAVQNRGGMCGALASNWIKEHFGVEE